MFRLVKTKLTVPGTTSKCFADQKFIKKTGGTAKQTVPEFADVVIIGGGSAGCHALYYLTKRGCKAILLEKSKLTSGTTWHSAGMFWRLRPNDVDIQLLDSTRKLLINLESETGINPGWTENGGLFIAHNKTRMEEYKRLVTAGKFFGVEAHVLSPQEAKNVYPLLDEKSFTGAIYSPQDGTVDPTMLVDALTKYARSQGARIIEECPVTRILIQDNGFGASKNVTGVETPYGTIRTNCVLNAAGVWSKNLSKTAGLDIPLIPMKHAYVVTEAIEGVQGMPNIRDHDSSIYLKVQGNSLHIGGYEPNPVILKSLPGDFSFCLYELDWTIFNVHVKSMIELIPKLSTTGIKSTVCGPESFTPDHKPIMGEDPRCNGFFYSCGYNSAGMMFGGGCGEQIASWIIDGRPEKHMYNYDVRRFTPEQTRDSVWANERSHEAYAKNYSIVFPHDQPLSGRKFKTDEFHDILLKYGAVMQEAQGWERPGWYQPGKITIIEPYDYYGNYGSLTNSKDNYARTLKKEHTFNFPDHHHTIGEEVHACRNKAVLFNLSYFGKYYLCGPQSCDAANYLFTANVNRELNRTVYTCTLNEKGGVESDCTVTLIDTGSGGAVDPIFQGKAFYIVAGGLSSYHTYSHLNRTISRQGFEVTLHDATENMGILSLQGPHSRSILERLTETDLSGNQFQFLMSKVLSIKGQIVRIFRISFVGELGYELHIPRESCGIIINLLFEIGKDYELQLAGFRAMYSLSCEKGYHLWGSDLRPDDNPVEAGLGFVCRQHDLYQGKEAVDKLKTIGVKRKLIHVHVKNDKLPLWGLETLYRNNSVVGYLRRAEYSYFYGNSIGRAYIVNPNGDNVTRHFIETGDYSVEVMGVKYPAKAYLTSTFDPENKRIHGNYS
ncbi:sarcosine dehydrogenase, mitochondrial [Aphidius gifuensis]|uniref:sarcosine dehydrogenase, mitochondrial n=1 Tax=Aphidius gifuensis TaxID=684658 RepID=UPI001CDC551F|nr:sarcosine dehydrogenase, mitochondrial [Aphidius gifuensis]XP_044012112.1 sarcosine dehydrogenase, mitochondrial [Aphidius gifuensis]